MNIEYQPNAARGQQFIINGVRLSRLDAAAALRNAGLSINQANQKITEAKLRQLTGTA